MQNNNRIEAQMPILAGNKSKINVSFEFFPPKDDKMSETLWESVKRLEVLSPKFVSVTYGAGGSTRERTHDTVIRIKKETNLEPAAHLTCIGSSKAEIKDIADKYWDAGVRHIVALRGDMPDGYNHDNSDYKYATDLIADLKKYHDFEVSVSAYPEKHPEAKSLEADIDVLKKKVELGATRAISQFFFDVDNFLRYRDKCVQAGINIPIVPGVLPVTNFARTVSFAEATGTSIPKNMHYLFEGLDNDAETRKLVASTLAIEMCQALQKEGIEDFHFYTLNRAELTFAICHVLGVRG